MAMVRYFLSNENYYQLYLTDSQYAINSTIDYLLDSKSNRKLKHINSKKQVNKCLDFIEALHYYKTNTKRYKYHSMNRKVKEIKYSNNHLYVKRSKTHKKKQNEVSIRRRC
jgi:hypothetical protein